MDSNKQQTGRLGGKVTLRKYGREHYREIGKKGGRPKLPTLDETRQKQAIERNAKIDKLQGSNDLKSLKKLWKIKQSSIQ